MPKKCCMNCEYFWARYDVSFCTIDKEIVPEPLEQIKFCPAFRLWWGAIDEKEEDIKTEKIIKTKTKKQEEMKELQTQILTLQIQRDSLKNKIYCDREWIITLSNSILELKKELKSKEKQPPIIMNPPQQIININNSQVNIAGPPKRLQNATNNIYGMNEDEYNTRKGSIYKGCMEDLKKDERFIKRKGLCIVDALTMEEIRD